jgi:aflatoxin B1 aldehyde reductase
MLHRSIEPELFPCLRRYDMVFYSYSPLAGGYPTSRYDYENETDEVERGSRFDPNTWPGKAIEGGT